MSHGIELGISRIRIIALVIYVLFGVTNQVQFTMFANIVEEAKVAFHTSSFSINILFVAFPIVFVLCCFPACDLVNHLGLKKSLVTGASLNALAAVLKLIAAAFYPQFSLLAVAQFCCGFAQLFLLGTPPLLTAVWFPADERVIATAFGSLATFLGMALGFIVSPLAINQQHHDTDDFVFFFAIIAAACILVLAALLWIVPEEPHLPPSHTSPMARRIVKQRERQTPTFRDDPPSARRVQNVNYDAPHVAASTRGSQDSRNGGSAGPGSNVSLQTPFVPSAPAPPDGASFDAPYPHALEDPEEPFSPTRTARSVFKLLRQHSSFRWLCISVGGVTGVLTGVAGVLAQLTQPLGITEEDSGWITSVGILIGSAACVVVGPIVDATHKYKRSITILQGGAVAFFVVAFGLTFLNVSSLSVSVIKGMTYGLGACIVIICIFVLPAIPTAMELGVELTYPVDEVLPATAIMCSQALFQIISTMGLSILVGNVATQDDTQLALGVASGVILLLIILFGVGVEEKLHRIHAEAASKKDHAAIVSSAS